jgi:hypothetical protein
MMTEAPGIVAKEQLEELGIELAIIEADEE